MPSFPQTRKPTASSKAAETTAAPLAI
jgi:hypothetical protein